MKAKFLWLGILMTIICMGMPCMQVQASELTNVLTDTVELPDTKGMSAVEAETVLKAVVLPGNEQIEIIKTYQYSDSIAADVVLQQSVSGTVSVDVAGSVNLVISLGQEPVGEQLLEESDVNEAGAFGLSAYREEPAIIIDGSYEDWSDKPYSWEYNWDNSEECWFTGVWSVGDDGLQGYTCPQNTYDANVRHKVSLFVDGQYAYLYVQFARCYDKGFIGWDYMFSLGEGQEVKFVLTDLDGSDFTTEGKEPGVYELVVKHGDSALSWQNVLGAKAFLKINEQKYNAELEMCIPLSQMKEQDSNIDTRHIGVLQWWSPNLTYRRVSASGAGTMPFVLAGVALAGIPLSTMLVKKRGLGKRRKKDCE